MDEDVWTDLNFGNSTNCANTSEDSVSDLDSDTDLQEYIHATFIKRSIAKKYMSRQIFLYNFKSIKNL